MNNINNGHTIVKQWSLNCMLTYNNHITMNDNCMLTFNNCITMNDNCMTIEWQLYDYWMTTVWLLNDNCMTTEWQLYDYWMTTVWLLNDNCMTIEWQLNDHKLETKNFFEQWTIFYSYIRTFVQFVFRKEQWTINSEQRTIINIK